MIKYFVFFIAIFFLVLSLDIYAAFNINIDNSEPDSLAASKVLVLTYDGAINPACADYFSSGIKKAEKEHYQSVIIRLNTPGGLLESTRIIVSSFLKSTVPVIVYVDPPGSRAASAGVFVTIAANIAAMAPGTNIGAAHPVTLQGQQDSVMMEKATNDAVAFIKSISEKRNRNIQWAENAVRKSVSITENEALKKNVINLVAKNLKDLLTKIDGMKVQTAQGETTINTRNALVTYDDMNFVRKLLSLISDPNIAYILFMLGTYGLLFELFNPGSIFPGVIGAICIILAFYALQTLPINYAGLALIIIAIILFILEIKIVSHGILTIGGIISLILGSMMLINVDSFMQVITISWEVIAFVVILTILFFLIVIGFGIKAQRLKPKTGSEGLINETGKAITDLNPAGEIKIHGELWKAETGGEIISNGSKVIVISVSNLILKVRKSE
jgi:membrane-bound serine protease (ClpP class)